ncbi:DUF3999 family protein [Cesiribacter andamanensis]|uniref:DUF3999 domain-containing protein n=1 Tax=Cesiribacter andamanensis AMV16 TaxID=1279009 RepID=M7N104_9BACT|nr:DUF3999 family protein [Cesiribacter andamanensis]EMR00987.1 hypothetical protein ADICEAN_03884 [Cesiribacter andamanensis AMV16]
MNLRPSLFVSLTLVVVLLAEAKAQYRGYAYQRQLQGQAQQWHAIPLPDSLFGRLQPNLADIRILGVQPGGDTVEAPYVLRRHEREWVQKPLSFSMLNQSSQPGRYQYTFKLPQGREVNQLELQLDRENFDWRARLEGSHDQQEWHLLADRQRLLAIKNGLADYRFTTLRFPRTNYPFLRLSIYSDESPKLLGASLTELDTLPGRYQERKPARFAVVHDKKERQSRVEISLAQVVPVSAIRLQVADTLAYYRPLRIQYLADSAETPRGWQYRYQTLLSSTLSSLEGAEFSVPTTIARHFRLIIDNYDNAPLQLEGARLSSPQWELVARFAVPGTYYLVYGNAAARPARYDLDRFTDTIPEAPDPLQLGPEEQRQSRGALARPLFSHKGWLWAVMGAIMVLLGWFTLQMLRKG